MFNLNDSNLSYILFSPELNDLSSEVNKSRNEKACSILYSKDYTILSVKGLYNGEYENSLLSLLSEQDNDQLRQDLIYFLEQFEQDCGIIKYHGDTKPYKIFQDGSEKPLNVALYNSDSNNKTYLYDGVSFTFNEEKRYYFPKDKFELRTGMIIEYSSNDVWVEKQIIDLEKEYENLYKLLLKYSKIRIPID